MGNLKFSPINCGLDWFQVTEMAMSRVKTARESQVETVVRHSLDEKEQTKTFIVIHGGEVGYVQCGFIHMVSSQTAAHLVSSRGWFLAMVD